uniref:ATP synthase F0 subunit 6 n=1 Tax=Clinostomum complanatum TaxID=235145 RepID=A0A0F6PKJ1_CLICO|nr:ATP synthase F0 subunit 6 [Clinostomum complanatum]AJR28000.1 ATP synthase F0 subunit 6 [Clinostomum complanatum]
MFVSRLLMVYRYISLKFIVGVTEGFYGFVLFSLLCGFVLLRCPYIFGVGGFASTLLIFILPLFLSLFLVRGCNVMLFLSSFIPLGTPLWIAPFVCLAETISYVVRPVVLMIRPFLNLSIGAFGGAAIGGMCISLSYWLLVFVVILFLYNVFVALVHWFIISEILSFSVDH